MNRSRPASKPAVALLDFYPDPVNLREEVLAGLQKQPKKLAPKFFYDQYGSLLFETITHLPEYYLTRTEKEILFHYREEIAREIGEGVSLIELGSGSSQKVRILLGALSNPVHYTAIDISKEFLLQSVEELSRDFPLIHMDAICADFNQLSWFPRYGTETCRVVFFPGSTIGNFEPMQAQRFLKKIADMLIPGEFLLLGVDLKKEASILHRAYNDSQGVTAEFNLNLLRRINRECQANFDLRRFQHFAFYDEATGRVEMHLKSLIPHAVTVSGMPIHFARGETIHTENSYKYTVEEMQSLAHQAGFHVKKLWLDEEQLFSVQLWQISTPTL